MSQETCREQPTRCGLRDTVQSDLMNESESPIEEPCAFAGIVAVGSARQLEARRGGREKQNQIPRLLAAVAAAKTRNDNDKRHDAAPKRLSTVLPASVSSSTLFYTAAMRRIRSSCSALLSAPMVMASSTPRFNAYLSASS